MERIWHQEYPNNINSSVNLNEYNSLSDLLENSFEEYRTRPAFTNMGVTLNYDTLDQLSANFAAYLQNELGLAKGQRIALMMPNLLQYPICLFGAIRAGLVIVNVNPLYTERELEHQLKDSGAETIVIVENFARTLQNVLEKTPVKNVITTQLGDMLGFPKSLLVNSVVKYVKKMVPTFSIKNSIQFKDTLKIGAEKVLIPVNISQKDIAFLQYTGGTTGVSKGAILTHGNLLANIAQAKEWLKDHINPDQGELIITPLPLYHIFALMANCFMFSVIGGHNVLITNPRDLDTFVKEMSKWKFNAITGVNTLFNSLVNHEGFKALDFSNLKFTLGGGMAVQRNVAEKWEDLTKVPLIEAYGLTEASPAVCINPLTLEAYNGKIGVPLPNTDVTIRDDEGNLMPAGEAGELWVKGPQVMQGYWQKQEETDKVITPTGWLKTGDIATMDEKGYFQIVDRKKDMILVSGFNVFPNEIEDVAAKHSGILECAAIGIADEKTGEAVKLFVVPQGKKLNKDEVIAHCRNELTGYKVPKHIEFADELPKSNVGKILRKELRDLENKIDERRSDISRELPLQ